LIGRPTHSCAKRSEREVVYLEGGERRPVAACEAQERVGHVTCPAGGCGKTVEGAAQGKKEGDYTLSASSFSGSTRESMPQRDGPNTTVDRCRWRCGRGQAWILGSAPPLALRLRPRMTKDAGTSEVAAFSPCGRRWIGASAVRRLRGAAVWVPSWTPLIRLRCAQPPSATRGEAFNIH
jgi:hypothetical protein